MNLFWLSEQLIRRLRYAYKFIVIGLLIFIPMVVMSFMYQRQSSELISFNEKERLGVEYIAPLHQLITKLQQGRGLYYVQASSKDAGMTGEIDKNNAEIEQAFQATFAINDKLGEELKVDGTIHDIYNAWKKAGDVDPLNSYSAVISRSIKLIAEVGDSSNLILDPDLDSYYLMDGVINKIPFATEKLTQIRDLGATFLLAKSVTSEQRDQLLELLSLLNYSMNEISSGILSVIDENPALASELEASRLKLEEGRASFTKVVNEELIHATALNLSKNDYLQLSSAFIQHHSELYQVELKVLDKLIKARVDAYESKAMIFNIAVIIGFIILLYIFIGFYISVKKSISYISTSLIKVSEGDLTNTLVSYTKDEIGDIVNPINTVIQVFKNMISASKASSNKVTTSSSALSSAITETVAEMDNINQKMAELSGGSRAQFLHSEESSKAMNEIATHIQHIAESAQDVLAESTHSHQQALEGKLAIDGAFDQMNKINASVKDSSELVEFLTSQSEQVKNIVETIAKISAQTNILALNASIEAARAGEHGKGFAVVASEIQKLANQSKRSTDDITGKLEAISSKINSLGESMEHEEMEVGHGMQAIHLANDIFTGILASSQRLVDRVQQVSILTEQISASTEQVTASVHEVAYISKQSADNTNYASESMTKQAGIMKTLLESADELLQMTKVSKEQLSHFRM
ncbi:methyl-accepting chemotaxis sensory transducer [Paenibacillus curdlanolyticus YK9]|uniref:Methyl-accepting chemotaxis sensory transducer n=1 Tax=Paenibacillus curdlanolyticus YK9 TaxID=717606 RepID=E0ID22_9BACL|nr:methyl-accepting chemotaxis protein [Paenibacillus curdlanolyticus]EFM09477.1 methyl-accepting chemotaxis sensory transducer [Paenibacillus curdlanolyticus YK9]